MLRAPSTRIALLLVAGLLLLCSGCSSSFTVGGQDEGTIEYALSFPDVDPNGLMADMLPGSATLSFDREHQSMDLSAGMGVFKTSMVVNTPDQVVDYHMSIMGKNLVAALSRRDLMAMNRTPPCMAVVETEARDTIAGLPCRKAYLVYDGISTPEAEVWYTEALAVDAPNWYGPFSDIPGMLMRYELVQNNIRMRLEATKVQLGMVDPAKFALRKDHQLVSAEVFGQQMEEVLGTFSQ